MCCVKFVLDPNDSFGLHEKHPSCVSCQNKRELAKDPNLATEDWNRFLPKFSKEASCCDGKEVLYAISTRVIAKRDLEFVPNLSDDDGMDDEPISFGKYKNGKKLRGDRSAIDGLDAP